MTWSIQELLDAFASVKRRARDSHQPSIVDGSYQHPASNARAELMVIVDLPSRCINQACNGIVGSTTPACCHRHPCCMGIVLQQEWRELHSTTAVVNGIRYVLAIARTALQIRLRPRRLEALQVLHPVLAHPPFVVDALFVLLTTAIENNKIRLGCATHHERRGTSSCIDKRSRILALVPPRLHAAWP
jgi:hypothetical protein